MTRLLQLPDVAVTARPLGAPDPSLDPLTVALVEQVRAEAFAQGRAEGEAAGRCAAVAECRAAAAVVGAAVDRAADEVRALRTEESRATVELAAAVARVVLDREPCDDSVVLLGRVREALATLDDAAMVVHVHPHDAAALVAGLASTTGITVASDPGMPAGEARILGHWARADLTRAAAWDAVGEVLDAHA